MAHAPLHTYLRNARSREAAAETRVERQHETIRWRSAHGLDTEQSIKLLRLLERGLNERSEYRRDLERDLRTWEELGLAQEDVVDSTSLGEP